MAKSRNTYLIESTRLPDWDYASAGAYFVTICTREHTPYFGEVMDGEMHLSPVEEIAAEEWVKTTTIRKNVSLDAWVVMPNHVHGILIIHEPDNTPDRDVSNPRDPVETPRRGVSVPRQNETHQRCVSTPAGHREMSRSDNKWKPGCLGAIINQYKGACTKRIRTAGFPDFAWQARFYEHILRSELDLQQIREYIMNNPLRWGPDHLLSSTAPHWIRDGHLH